MARWPAAAAAEWRARLQRVSRRPYHVPNMFAGSVLDLKPDTDYEARFIIDDPDGVIGNPERNWRWCAPAPNPSPTPAAGKLHVYPHGHIPAKSWSLPSKGLMCAYNEWCAGTDWATSGPAQGAGRRYPRSACWRLSIQPLRVHQQRKR